MKKDKNIDLDATKTKCVFIMCQFVYTILSILPAKLFYENYVASLSFISLMFAWACWNGAAYYLEVFSKRYNLQFITLDKQKGFENSKKQESNKDGGENPTVNSLVELLHNTPSPVDLVYHDDELGMGIPLYFIKAMEEVAGHSVPNFKDPPNDLDVEKYRLAVQKYMELIGPGADEVFPNLMIGNKAAAEDTSYLVELGVTHLLNCAHASGSPRRDTVHPDLTQLEEQGIKVLQLDLRDHTDFYIAGKFEETNIWVKQALDCGGKVLVNCFQGGSRSAAVVLAYLIQEKHIKVQDALEMVKRKRDIRPNNGFLQQLIHLTNSSHGEN